MRFCTTCGTAYESDAVFCTGCGAARPATAALAAPPARRAWPARILVAGAVAFAAVAGTAAVFLLPGAGSKAAIRAGVDAFVRDGDTVHRLTCMQSLPFAGRDVHADQGNATRRADYDALVQAGFLQPPVLQKGGWFMADRLRYAKTPLGQGATQGNRLCVPATIGVAEVRHDAPAESIAGKHVLAHFKYRLGAKPAWQRAPLQALMARELQLEGEQSVLLWWDQDQWRPLPVDPEHLAVVRNAAPQAAQETFRFPQWSARGGQDNPLLGRWRQKAGWFGLEIELGESTAVFGGESRAVRYEAKSGRVLLHTDGADTEVLTVLDRNHFTIGRGERKAMLFERIQSIK